MGAIGKFFRAIGAGIMWIFKDDEEQFRARQGLPDKADKDDDAKEEKKRDIPEYDTWEQIDNFRLNFWLGSWATHKIRTVGEEKVKAQLAALEKKREEERRRKEEEGE